MDFVSSCPLQQTYLHLHRLAVDKLNAGHDAVEDYGGFLTGVEEDRVDLALNGDGRLRAAERVHYVVHLGTFYYQPMVPFLVLL